MRAIGVAAVLIVSAVSLGAPAVAYGQTVVPFELFANHVLLPVEIAGRGPFRLILDTGMPYDGAILFSSPRLDSLLPAQNSADGESCGDAGGRQLSAVSLAVPGIVLANQTVMVVPPPWSPAESQYTRAEGIIGLALFSRYVVRMDYEQSLVSFAEPAAFRYDGGGESLPIPRDSFGIPQVECAVELADGVVVRTRLVLDTGASHAMSLHIGSAERMRLPSDAVPGRLGQTMYGEVMGHFGRVTRLRLGELSLENVVASFTSGDPVCPAEAGKQGNLGSQVLQRFHVTIDYSRDRMILEPNGRYREPFEHEMAGITFGRTADGGLAVDRVLSGSAASESGLQAGDVVLEIDGHRATELDRDAVGRLLRREGHTLAVRFTRGGNERTVELRLRRIV